MEAISFHGVLYEAQMSSNKEVVSLKDVLFPNLSSSNARNRCPHIIVPCAFGFPSHGDAHIVVVYKMYRVGPYDSYYYLIMIFKKLFLLDKEGLQLSAQQQEHSVFHMPRPSRIVHNILFGDIDAKKHSEHQVGEDMKGKRLGDYCQ